MIAKIIWGSSEVNRFLNCGPLFIDTIPLINDTNVKTNTLKRKECKEEDINPINESIGDDIDIDIDFPTNDKPIVLSTTKKKFFTFHYDLYDPKI